MVAVLLEAMKEQQAEISELKKQQATIAELKEKIAQLENKLEQK
jgi:molybdopterin converting factor small subunit